MRERLWEVAEECARRRIDLLAVEAEGIRPAHHSLEHPLTLLELARQDERVGEPEAADREDALAARETIVRGVAIQHPVAAEVLERSRDRPPNTGVSPRQESHHRNQ